MYTASGAAAWACLCACRAAAKKGSFACQTKQGGSVRQRVRTHCLALAPAPHPCSQPNIEPTVLGPYTASMLLTPPPNGIGQPFEYYEIKVGGALRGTNGTAARAGAGCCPTRRTACLPRLLRLLLLAGCRLR